MDIKYVTNVRIPTSRAQGYAIMKMCEEFSTAGANVELTVPNRRNNEPESDAFKYYKIKNNFKLRRVSSIDLLGPFEAFGKLFYWIDMLSFLLSLWFRKVLKKGEILYTRDYLVTLLFSKKNLIYLEIHDIPKNQFLFKKVLQKPRLFFVLNKYLKEALVELGVSQDKIHILPSGVDTNFFQVSESQEDCRRKLKLPLDKKIVMYTGHFYKWKGIETLAEASKFLPDLNFVFVGGVDPEFSEFKQKYSNFKNVLIFPFTARTNIPFYIKASDIVAVPNSPKESISSKYTSPLKLFEYMASGKPIIASDLPSVREVLNSDNAVLVAPDSPKDFAQGIQHLLLNPDLSSKISREATSIAEKNSWSNRAEKILKIINENSF